MHFVVNIAENASPATNASAKRKCTTKRFRRKPSNQQTEWQEEARRKYMKESRTRIRKPPGLSYARNIRTAIFLIGEELKPRDSNVKASLPVA
ncbi:MAG: hypothetical protein Q9157_000371 [Trypethelium eluteriae]